MDEEGSWSEDDSGSDYCENEDKYGDFNINTAMNNARKTLSNEANKNLVLCIHGADKAGEYSDAVVFVGLLLLAKQTEDDPRYAWDKIDCHLCKKEIKYINSEEMIIIHKEKQYAVLSTNVLSNLEENFDKDDGAEGFLRCVYCFNTFHHRPCTFPMSKMTYLHHRKNKSWSCPSCVPIFVPKHQAKREKTKKRKRNNKIKEKKPKGRKGEKKPKGRKVEKEYIDNNFTKVQFKRTDSSIRSVNYFCFEKG